MDDAPQSASADFLTIETILARVWAGRWLVVCLVALSVGVGVAYVLVAKKWYRAEAVLMLAEGKPMAGLTSSLAQFGGLASLAGVTIGPGGKAEPLAILRSREFAGRFIEERGLVPVIFGKHWDPELKSWKPDTRKIPDLSDAVDFFHREILHVGEDKKSGLILVGVEWTDAGQAAQWANVLVDMVNQQMRDRTIRDANSSIEYLRGEMRSTDQVSLQQAVGRLIESEMEKLMIARGNDEFAFRVIDAAQAPKRGIRPRIPVVLFASAMIGGALSLLALWISGGVWGSRNGVSSRA